MHRGRLHTHQSREKGCVSWVEIMRMQGLMRYKRTIFQIEKHAIGVVFKIGVETQEMRHAQEENEVKITEMLLTQVEPLDRIPSIVEQRSCNRFAPQSRA